MFQFCQIFQNILKKTFTVHMCTKQQVKQITTLQMKKEEQEKKYIIHPSKTLLSWTNDSSVAIIRTGFKILLCKLALQVGQGPLQKWTVQFHLLKYLWVVTFNSFSTVKAIKMEPGTTNKKEQMLPQRLITLTRGIQPIKNYIFFIFSNFLVRTLQCKRKFNFNFCS